MLFQPAMLEFQIQCKESYKIKWICLLNTNAPCGNQSKIGYF